MNKTELEFAVIGRVIDADTIVLEDGRTLRLLNINAPEKSSSLSSSPLRYMKQYENQTIKIQITELDKYQRSLARIYDLNNNYLNLELVAEGLASTFLVSPEELNEFKKAEEKAIEEGKGIWKHSEYWDCLISEIDKEDEFVTLTNLCNNINLNSWELKDESRKTFKFPNININKGQNIILYSTEDQNDIENEEITLYWQQKTNVWNNDRDTLYIFDSSNNIVHFNSYGY